MAEVIEDRVKQTSTSTGVGDFVLSGSLVGFRSFASVMQIGDTFHGCIVAVDSTGAPTGQWEVGYYKYKAANTISRDTVRVSSATSNAKVSFSSGTKHVFLDLTAYQIRRFAIANNAGTAVAPFGQTASDYTALTFQEEFSGTTFDTTKWKEVIFGGANNATKNYKVEGGNMNVYPQVDGNGGFFNRDFTTDGLFSQRYGFFEAELKLPVGAGLAPQFSLSDNNDRLIEVMFSLTGAPDGQWSTSNLHPLDYSMSRYAPSTVGDEQRYRNFTPAGLDLSAAFHKYGLRWDATTIRWFFDGAQVGPTLNHTSMTTPLYIFFGLRMLTEETTPTVGSGTLGPSNRYTPQGIGNSFQVNYVRAWQIA